MEFAYDGGGMGKGGDVTLYYDGKEVGKGRVDQTQGFIFSADETTDVGHESGHHGEPRLHRAHQQVQRQDRLGANRFGGGRQGRRPLHRARRTLPHRDGSAVVHAFRTGNPLSSASDRNCFSANRRPRPAWGIRMPAHRPSAPGVSQLPARTASGGGTRGRAPWRLRRRPSSTDPDRAYTRRAATRSSPFDCTQSPSRYRQYACIVRAIQTYCRPRQIRGPLHLCV